MFAMTRYCDDFGIAYFREGESGKVSRGWIGLLCPFCSGNKPILGFNLRSGALTCYRCGNHTINAYLARTAPATHSIKALWGKYWSSQKDALWAKFAEDEARPTHVDLPSRSQPMAPPHRRYLESRGFDPRRIATVYGVQGTDHIGSFARRLVMPITFRNRLVSWTTRDITDTAEEKYMSCRKDLEVVPHKQMLYGIDLAKGNSCVVVEGITDMWRLGPGAVATFGVKFTTQQIKLLAACFDRIVVFYDCEGFAKRQASAMASQLISLGKEAEVLELDMGDPGNLPDDEAAHIMCSVL